VHRSMLDPARRLALAGLSFVLAVAVVSTSDLAVHLPRPASAGTVRDVALSFASGAGSGRLGVRTGLALRAVPGRAGAWVSGAVAAGPARLVGLSWARTPDAPWTRAGGARTWLRTRSDPGGWSAWQAMEPDDHGPDPGGPEPHPDRVFTEGSWLPPGTRAVQVRVDLPGRAPASVERLVAHLVSPDMAPTPGSAAGPGGATAATSQPPMITRARWGADERIRRGPPSYASTVRAAFVHHTVQANTYSKADSAALVRADYVYHVKTRGWNDIGYNFLVDRFGQVFEGRYGGATRAVVGACTAGFNTSTSCVALLGTFTATRPPAPMMGALTRLLAWKLDLGHVDPQGTTVLTSAGGGTSRYAKGTRVRLRTISGHRDTSFTSCPGDAAYRLLPGLRVAVARTGLPKIYGGAPNAGAVDPLAGSTVTLAPRFSQAVRWAAVAATPAGSVLRRWSGTGAAARIVWNGRNAGGGAAPAGRATLTVTAVAGGHTARPLTVGVTVRGQVVAGARLPDGTLVAGAPLRSVRGGALWPYAGGAEARADAGPGPAVRAQPATVRGLTQPLAGLPDGALVREPSGAVWAVADGQRRAVGAGAAFTAHGWQAGAAVPVGPADLAHLPVGAPLGAGDPWPDGTLAAAAGRLWRIEDGLARPVVPAAAAAWRARTAVAAAGTGPAAIGAYRPGAELGFPDGTLLRTMNDGKVWVVSEGRRRRLPNRAVLAGLGYDRARIRPVRQADVRANPLGPALGAASAPPSGALLGVGGGHWLVVGRSRLAVPGALLGALRLPAQRVAARRLAQLAPARLSYGGGSYLRDRGGRVVAVSGGLLRPVAGGALLATGVRRAGLPLLSAASAGLLPLGPLVGAAAPFPDESLWRTQDGTLWRVEGGRRRPVAASAAASWTVAVAARPVRSTAASFAALPTGPLLGFRDGALVRDTSTGSIYAIAGGQRRRVAATAVLEQLGLPPSRVVAATPDAVQATPPGPDLG
jgi:N-acetylmuramoyl-L-alanine amidase